MSPFEINVLRFIFTFDNILVALMPWLKAMSVATVIIVTVLLTRKIIRRRTGFAKR